MEEIFMPSCTLNFYLNDEDMKIYTENKSELNILSRDALKDKIREFKVNSY